MPSRISVDRLFVFREIKEGKESTERWTFGKLSLILSRGPFRTATSDRTTRRSAVIVRELLSIVLSVALAADDEISLRKDY